MRVCLIGDIRSIHVRRWAKALSARGVDTSVLCFKDVDGFPDIPRRVFRHRKTAFADAIRRRWEFGQTIEEIGADIFHVHQLFYASLIYPLLRHPRLVVTPYGTEVFMKLAPKKERLKKRIIDSARVVVASSRFLLRAVGLSSVDSCGRVVHFGVDTTEFAPSPRLPDGHFRIGFVKHIEPRYGPMVLVEAARIIVHSHPHVQVCLYGKGSMEQEISEFLSRHGLEKHVFLCGEHLHETLPAVYAGFDITVMPSVCPEAFGVSAIESQACGVPVIASNTGGIPETIDHGRTGLLFEPGNVQDLARCIEGLLTDEKRRRAMGKAGVAWAKQFEWSNCVDEMIAVYRSIL